MELLSKSEFQKLADVAGEPCVSIYLPTHTAGPEIRQDPIQLKNLLQEAKDSGQQLKLTSTELDQLLEPAGTLLQNERFWRHQSCGLAIFLNRSGMRLYRLPLDFSPEVIVGHEFHLKPLIPLYMGEGYFYILALSQQMVRLFQATQYKVIEVPLEGVPTSLEAALRYDDPEEHLQYHSGGAEKPLYHGQGIGTTEDKTSIRRFFDRVNKGLHTYLNQETAPLVVASVEFLQPIFRESSSYPAIVEDGIYGNPEQMAPEDLHQAAWERVKPLVMRSQQEILERFAELQDTQKIGTRLEQIVPAAHNGQVDTLLVVKDAHSWGHFDPTTGNVTAAKAEDLDAVDLLDTAAVNTLVQGGSVYPVATESMPTTTPVAAIYRYEIPQELSYQTS